MGQQQLLLIVLGVIIVGIAVVVGINLFNANARESTKDTMVSEATNIGAMAQQYFKKPVALGGGGNTFVGFTSTKVPANILTTSTATYALSGQSTTNCTITGTPSTASGYTGFTVVCTVTPTSISSAITGS
ncbi:MAG: hypothetical protein WAR59_03845 [Ignavibacteriaceae bacterium]|jgi:hypothetical protein